MAAFQKTLKAEKEDQLQNADQPAIKARYKPDESGNYKYLQLSKTTPRAEIEDVDAPDEVDAEMDHSLRNKETRISRNWGGLYGNAFNTNSDNNVGRAGRGVEVPRLAHTCPSFHLAKEVTISSVWHTRSLVPSIPKKCHRLEHCDNFADLPTFQILRTTSSIPSVLSQLQHEGRRRKKCQRCATWEVWCSLSTWTLNIMCIDFTMQLFIQCCQTASKSSMRQLQVCPSDGLLTWQGLKRNPEKGRARKMA
jgi:hypothetical protein